MPFKRLRNAVSAGWRVFTKGVSFTLETLPRRLLRGWGAASLTNRTYISLVNAAASNALAARAIGFIGDQVAEILRDHVEAVRETPDGIETIEHPFLDLLQDPHRRHGIDWLGNGITWSIMGSGEFFLDGPAPASGPNAGIPRRLRLLYPDQFRDFRYDRDTAEIVGYEFAPYPTGASRTMFGRRRTGLLERSIDDTLHVFNFNPRDPDRGYPVLLSVYRQLEKMEAADRWNRSLAETGGQLSGMLFPEGLEPGEQLPQSVVDDAQERYNNRIRSVREENGYLVMSGAYTAESSAVAPREAEFLEMLRYDGKLTTVGLGIDPVLLGEDSAKTYDNYRTALRVALVVSILPIVNMALEGLNRWAIPKYSRRRSVRDARLMLQTKNIPALQEDETARVERIVNAISGTLLSPDEGRAELGLEPKGADSLLVKFNVQPLENILRNMDPARSGRIARSEAIRSVAAANAAENGEELPEPILSALRDVAASSPPDGDVIERALRSLVDAPQGGDGAPA